MTKRTAYEDMVAALEKLIPLAQTFFIGYAEDAVQDMECGEAIRSAKAALVKAKKVPVEVGMFGTGAPEDVILGRIFELGRPTAGDVAEVKRASEGHPPDCVCWACACLRKLKGRGTL